MKVFALNTSRDFGGIVAGSIGQALAAHEERDFEDGEHKARPRESVRNEDVYVIQLLHADDRDSVNDKLCRLLFFLGALKDAGAAKVTAVVPYLAYARKDARTKPRDPVTTRYFAQIFESVGMDCILTMDVHNLAAFDNAFRCPVVHLEARMLFASHIIALSIGKDVCIVSPDVGGVKRARKFRDTLENSQDREVGLAFMEKQRSAGVVSSEGLVGDVKGKMVIIIDDLISTGGTIRRTVEACARGGADRIIAMATHGLFVGSAARVVEMEQLERLVIADTIPPFRLDADLVARKVDIVAAAPLFGEAIRRLNRGDSLSELIGDE